MTAGDQIPMFGEHSLPPRRGKKPGRKPKPPKRLTLLEAANKALEYVELFDSIDEGENTPDLSTDLVLIRMAIGEATEDRCWSCPTHCYDEERS